jgi:hypothetical protein
MCVNAVVCVPLSRCKCSSYYLNLSFFLYVLEQQIKEYYHNNSIKGNDFRQNDVLYCFCIA